MPVYLEDLAPGDVFTSVGRTLTEADIAAFAGVSGDYNRLHTDEPWVRAHTPFRGRIAHGLLVLAISSGLRNPPLDDLVVIAYLEETRRMVAPTYPGDTIHVVVTVDEVRASASRPESGIVRFAVEVVNDGGEVVQRGTDVIMVGRRPGTEA